MWHIIKYSLHRINTAVLNLIEKYVFRTWNTAGEHVVEEKRKSLAVQLSNLGDVLVAGNIPEISIQLEEILNYLSTEEYIDELNLNSSAVDSLKLLNLCCSLILGNLSKDGRSQNQVHDLQETYIGIAPLFERIQQLVWNDAKVMKPGLQPDVEDASVEDARKTENTQRCVLKQSQVEEFEKVTTEQRNRDAITKCEMKNVIDEAPVICTQQYQRIENQERNDALSKEISNLCRKFYNFQVDAYQQNRDDLTKCEMKNVIDEAPVTCTQQYQRIEDQERNAALTKEMSNLCRKFYNFQIDAYQHFERQYQFMKSYLRGLPIREGYLLKEEFKASMLLCETRRSQMKQFKKTLETFGQTLDGDCHMHDLKNWPFHPVFEYSSDMIYKNVKPLILKFQACQIEQIEHLKQTLSMFDFSRFQSTSSLTERTGAVRRHANTSIVEGPANEDTLMELRNRTGVIPTTVSVMEFLLRDHKEQKLAMVFSYFAEKCPNLQLPELVDAMDLVQQENSIELSKLNIQDILSQVETVLKVSSGSEECCAICLTGEGRKKLQCGHRFHQQCIRQWNRVNNNCPVCRRPGQ